MDPLSSPLLTDLYELTMLQAYYERGMTETVVFELFVRKLPPGPLPQPGLEESRAHCLRQLARLPQAFPYPVEISPALRALAGEVDRSVLTARTTVRS
jgi:hypothetical protein